jgi:hypothetical protein
MKVQKLISMAKEHYNGSPVELVVVRDWQNSTVELSQLRYISLVDCACQRRHHFYPKSTSPWKMKKPHTKVNRQAIILVHV